MDSTVFLTVLAGVLTYVIGQLVVKLVIDPVQETRKTIGLISHALMEHAGLIHNPGIGKEEAMDAASKELRKLSSQLQSHLYLVPLYRVTAWVFRLPSRENLLAASRHLIGLANSIHRASDRLYTVNPKRIIRICEALGIYLTATDKALAED